MISLRDYLADVEFVHFLDGHFGVDCFEEGGGCVFTGLGQDDPPSARMSDHELRDIIDVVVDYYPAITYFRVVSDFLPCEFSAHLTVSVINV